MTFNDTDMHRGPSGPAPDRQVAQMAELVGGLAHELRNPLSTMMVNLQLLAEELRDESANPEDARRRALLKVGTLRREATRLKVLFDQFLNLTGSYEVRWSEENINGIVSDLAAFIEPEARAQGVEVRLDLADDPVPCRVDPQLLRQALLNIVINARQAMPEGGTMTLTTRKRDKIVEIDVADNGIGVENHDRDRILRPFYSTKSVGTGLGLSITQRIIADHHGALSFTSEPGKGTTFTVRLPTTS